MKNFSQFITEEKDPSEYDQEGEMAIILLSNLIDAAEELIHMLDDDENLPEWAQAKITKAEDYIDSVRDYMLNLGDDEDEYDDEESSTDYD